MELWDITKVVEVFKEARLCTSRQGFVNKFNRYLRPLKKDGRGGKNFYNPEEVMQLVQEMKAGKTLADIYGEPQGLDTQEGLHKELRTLREEVAVLKSKNQQLLLLKDRLLEIIAQFGRE